MTNPETTEPTTTTQKITYLPTQAQQSYANYQSNDLTTGQQTYQKAAPYQAPYPMPYLKPENTYHFTEYVPAMSPSTPYTGNQMYSGYYPASAPAPSSTTTGNLFSSQPAYVPGGKREISKVVSVDFANVLEKALQATDGNLIIARHQILNHMKNKKRRKIWKYLGRRKKSKLPPPH